MKAALARWVSDADAVSHLDLFRGVQPSLDLSHIRGRADDYYIALVGALFEQLRTADSDQGDWAGLGNAFTQFTRASERSELGAESVAPAEAALFAATAFYCGGFPASSSLTLTSQAVGDMSPAYRA